MKSAELHPAYVWDCDDCGRENFERAIAVEMDEDTLADLREQYGVEPWEEGEFLGMPTYVVCRHCGRQYSSSGEV